MLHWLKQKRYGTSTLSAIGLCVFSLGFYFTVVTNPWVTFCPGTQSNDISHR